VIDIGLDGPEDRLALDRIEVMIESIGQRYDSLPSDTALLAEPGSELADLIDSLPDPPVDLRISIRTGLASARGALSQISGLIRGDGDVPTTPAVLQTLTRSALLGAARVAYVLGPPSKEARQDNANMVLRQEGRSLILAYNAFEQFKVLRRLVPPADIVAAQRARNNAIQNGAQPISEYKTLMTMATVIGEMLAANGYGSREGEPLAEMMAWIFNVYSGVAHGFGWPHLVPGSESMPGHFISDLYMVTCVADFASDITMRRRTKVAA
jgi:hypothetical protein